MRYLLILGFVSIFVSFFIIIFGEGARTSETMSAIFLISLMLIMLYPLFLLFAASAGILQGFKASYGIMAIFFTACFLFLAARHCLMITLNDLIYYQDKIFDQLFVGAAIMNVSIVTGGYIIKVLRYFHLVDLEKISP